MVNKVVLDGELSLSNVLDGQGGTYNRYNWRGYSAYEIAVQEGFEGTKAEWLASLQGATGPQGEKGDQGIQGPKGDSGDDYVLTEQDKQEIAGMVDTPVATASKAGVVKVDAGLGVRITVDGRLATSAPSESEVKTGANAYKPVVPSNQHIAAFYGLAKVAGHDEKSSTLPVGQYTEEAKAAIQNMLGVPSSEDIEAVEEILNGSSGGASINLFNKDDPDLMSGKYLDEDGNTQTLSSFCESGYIPCENGDTFTFTRSGEYFTSTRPVCFYDADKQFIRGTTANMPTITVANADAKYFRIAIKRTELDVCMVVKNDTAIHEYVPYSGGGDTPGLVDKVADLQNAALPWSGKRAVMLGDSIVYNDGHDGINGYPHYLKGLGFDIITNKGVSGACVASHSERTYEDVCTTVDSVDFSTYDLALIAGGSNDFHVTAATPIGTLVNSVTLTDFDKTTFIGALQYIITKIHTSNVSIKLGLFTPLKRSGWYTANSEGKVLKDYADAVKEVAEYYSIPVLDFYSTAGLSRKNMYTFTSDGLHPNNAGYEFFSRKLVAFVRDL